MANTSTLDEQARRALDSNMQDLARLAIERKNVVLQQVASLDNQINDIETQQQKLENTEKRLSTKVEEFKTRKEVIKAQYSSAEAQVRIKESITGISEEMIDSGVLIDYTAPSGSIGEDIEAELDKVALKSSVDEELEKLKAERTRKKNKDTKKEQKQEQELGESEVVSQ